MRNNYFKLKEENVKFKLIKFLLLILLTFNIQKTQAQKEFSCSSFFAQASFGKLKKHHPILGNFGEEINDNKAKYNAGGYNVKDNYMYAISAGAGIVKTNHLMRIFADGTFADLGNINFYSKAGDVDDKNNLWIKKPNSPGLNSLFKIKEISTLTTGQATRTSLEKVNFTGGRMGDVCDLAFISTTVNGTIQRRLWGGIGNKICYWDLDTKKCKKKKVIGLLDKNYGAAYTDASKRLYLFSQLGHVYVIEDYNSDVPHAKYLMTSPAVSDSEGFSCPNAKSPFDQNENGILDFFDPDADGDGVSNITESGGVDPYTDADGDGVFAYLDDNDNDRNIKNKDGRVEPAFDQDSDNFPNFLDLDSDNDGISDNYEAGAFSLDTNNDGKVDDFSTDADNNGIPDAIETFAGVSNWVTPIDTDNDNIPDYFDLDSDNDGIPDAVEAQVTSGYIGNDGDVSDNVAWLGVPSYDFIIPQNTDKTGNPDYLDTDSDDDGISDVTESGLILSGNDNNNDGIDDSINASYNDPNGDINIPFDNLTNIDGNRKDVDYRSFNNEDGITTIDEFSNDCDADGIPDHLDLTDCDFIPEGFSPNGDGVNDTFVIPALSSYPDFKLEIFNRWGNKVYAYDSKGRTELRWWDGYSTGWLTYNKSKPLPTGTYYCIIYFNKNNRKPVSKWIYLNR